MFNKELLRQKMEADIMGHPVHEQECGKGYSNQ